MDRCQCVGDGANTIGKSPLGGGCCGGTGPAAYLVRECDGTVKKKCTYCLVRMHGDEVIKLLVTPETLPVFDAFDEMGGLALRYQMEDGNEEQ